MSRLPGNPSVRGTLSKADQCHGNPYGAPESRVVEGPRITPLHIDAYGPEYAGDNDADDANIAQPGFTYQKPPNHTAPSSKNTDTTGGVK